MKGMIEPLIVSSQLLRRCHSRDDLDHTLLCDVGSTRSIEFLEGSDVLPLRLVRS